MCIPALTSFAAIRASRVWRGASGSLNESLVYQSEDCDSTYWSDGAATTDGDHPPVVPAFAYRFDAADRSIVIARDTAPSDNLVKLAKGADVLVHSAMYPPAIDRLVARVPNAPVLKASILAHQTSAEDAGRLAQAAGVNTLVLSHLVPPDDPEVTDRMWADAARVNFGGSVIVGKDLLEI
jgi:ribonuclease BN (tRNA processing enzyme)